MVDVTSLLKKDNKILLLLFFVFFFGIGFLMVLHVYKDPNIGHADGANSAIVARNLAEGKGYTVDHVLYFITYYPGLSHPESIWPLGLPTLVALFFRVFGESTFIAKLPNILLFLLFVVTMFCILRRRYNTFIAFFASIFTLINVNLFRVVIEPYHDIGFLIFTHLSFIAMALWMVEQKKKYLVLLGLFTGVTILFKQTGLLLPPFFIFIIMLSIIKKAEKNKVKNILKSTSLFLLIALVVGSPWLIRNTMLFGNPIYSQARQIGHLIDVPGTQQDEYFRIFFNDPEPVFEPLKQASIYEKLVLFNLKSWNHISRMLRHDNIVPGVILFLFLFGLVLLPFNEFEKNLVKINILFIFLYTLFLIYLIHTETRYFLFVIPFISFISAKVLDYFYMQIIKPHYKLLYVFILCFLLFYLTFPFLSLMYKDLSNFSVDPVYSFVEDNTPLNAVVMTRDAPRITWHTGRKTVMVPFGEVSDFYTIIKSYNVSHVLILNPLWYYATHLNVRPWVYDLDKMVGNITHEHLFNETICTGEIEGGGCLYSVDVTVLDKEDDINIQSS